MTNTDASASQTIKAPTFKAGLVQMCASRSVEQNLIEATRLIREAASGGAQYVQTPEITTLMETDRARLFVAVRPEEGNPALAHFRALAHELKIWLHIGSMAVAVSSDKLANRGFLISPTGAIAARYDKIHMFDVQLPSGEVYRESKNYRPGGEAVLADLPWAKLGVTICYDLRFPGLYRALAHAGATIMAIPSSFTVPTGKAHWHVLMRARAIETGSFVVAAAQGGTHEAGRNTYGHSLIVDPWGEVIAEIAGDRAGVVVATIDTAKIIEARGRVPSLTHDRTYQLTHAGAKAGS
jgi:deaminated glutathione amidase